MAAKKVTRKTGRKTGAKKTTKKAAPKARPGLIAHTELVSADPAATKAWAKKAFGWKFEKPMPTPDGAYEVFTFGTTGGGIRKPMGPEAPGSIPYVEAADIRRAVAKAEKAGAKVIMPPMEIPGAGGSIAVLVAPGGPAIGIWAAK